MRVDVWTRLELKHTNVSKHEENLLGVTSL